MCVTAIMAGVAIASAVASADAQKQAGEAQASQARVAGAAASYEGELDKALRNLEAKDIMTEAQAEANNIRRQQMLIRGQRAVAQSGSGIAMHEGSAAAAMDEIDALAGADALAAIYSGINKSVSVRHQGDMSAKAAAQAVPGPLFTFAAYLGAVMTGTLGGWVGGLALLVAIFVPAFLMVAGALPFWEPLRQRYGVQRAMAGVNAAVVGVLAAALYDPVWTSAIHSRADFGLALAAFGLLVYGRQSPVLVVALAAAVGWTITP